MAVGEVLRWQTLHVLTGLIAKRSEVSKQTGERVVSTRNFLGKDKRVADPNRLTAK
jgi:hypothetical protein